jgi:hypothetical protein
MARLITLTCWRRRRQPSASLTLKVRLPTVLSPQPAQRYSSPMATTTTKNKYRCMQCERTEDRCDCERYCCLCQAQMDIRLCRDGLFYCLPCREACDYKVAD